MDRARIDTSLDTVRLAFLTSLLMFVLSVLVFHAGAGEIPCSAAGVDVHGEKRQHVLDTIWNFPVLYQGDGPFIQRFAFIGRYQGQYAVAESNRGDFSGWTNRRFRFGTGIQFLRHFGFDLQFNLEREFSRSGRLVRNFDTLLVEWAPRDDLAITVGRQKPLVGQEYAISSTQILTFERSLLIPWYDITDKIQVAFRYHFAGSESDSGILTRNRYERMAIGDGGVIRGDRYHSFYAGLNYYVGGGHWKGEDKHRLKLMTLDKVEGGMIEADLRGKIEFRTSGTRSCPRSAKSGLVPPWSGASLARARGADTVRLRRHEQRRTPPPQCLPSTLSGALPQPRRCINRLGSDPTYGHDQDMTSSPAGGKPRSPKPGSRQAKTAPHGLIRPVVIYPFLQPNDYRDLTELYRLIARLDAQREVYARPITVMDRKTHHRMARNKRFLKFREQTVAACSDIHDAWCVDTCQMWYSGLGTAFEHGGPGDVYWLIPGDFNYGDAVGREVLGRLHDLPEICVELRQEVCIGEIATDHNNPKQLIDTYGTFALLYTWFPEEAGEIRQYTERPRSEFFAIQHSFLGEMLNRRWYAYEQTVVILLHAVFARKHITRFLVGNISDLPEGRETLASAMQQVERTERVLKTLWRERNEAQAGWSERYRGLEARSEQVRQTAFNILENLLD